MRYAVLMLFVLIVGSPTTAQTTADAARTTGDQLIRSAMNSGALEGHLALVGYLGDAAAVSITKALGDKVPTNDEMQTAIWILRQAFYDVRFVEKVSDRKPETALFILRYFETIATDPQLRKDLHEAKQTILDRTKSATN